MTWQPRHRHPSVQACQVALTAAHQAQLAPSVHTARHNLQTALVNATVSREPVIESSLTVAARDAGTAMTQAPAVPLAKKSTSPPALDATASWCADDEAIYFLWKKEKRNNNKHHCKIRHPFVTAIYLFAYIYSKQYRRRVKLVNWRATLKPNPRQAFRCICFVNYIYAFLKLLQRKRLG
jgi:hypothetical protein